MHILPSKRVNINLSDRATLTKVAMKSSQDKHPDKIKFPAEFSKMPMNVTPSFYSH